MHAIPPKHCFYMLVAQDLISNHILQRPYEKWFISVRGIKPAAYTNLRMETVPNCLLQPTLKG